MNASPISSDARGRFSARWTAALLVNGVFGTLGLLILYGRIETTSIVWDRILVALAVTSLLLFLPAIRETARWLRFREAALVPDPAEGSLGGHLGGSLRLSGPRLRDDSFQVSAICLVSDGDRDEASGPSVHWMRTVQPRIDPGANGIRLGFAIPLPDDLPPTGAAHRWAVRVVAARRGADVDLSFTVPVARHDPPLKSSLPETADPPGEETDERAGRHIAIQRSGGTTVLRYRAGRSLGMGLTLTLFGLVFLGSGLFAGRASWQGVDGIVDILFSGVGVLFLGSFGLIGGLLAGFGIWLGGNALRVEVDPVRIRIRRSFLFPGRTREWSVADVESIEARIAGQQLAGARSRVSYTLKGIVRGGRPIPLGDGIQGPVRLERVARVLEEVTGVSVDRSGGRRSRRSRSPRTAS